MCVCVCVCVHEYMWVIFQVYSNHALQGILKLYFRLISVGVCLAEIVLDDIHAHIADVLLHDVGDHQ